MRIVVDNYQHRLLTRSLVWIIKQAKEQKAYGTEEIMHPFAIDELETLLRRINPTAAKNLVVLPAATTEAEAS